MTTKPTVTREMIDRVCHAFRLPIALDEMQAVRDFALHALTDSGARGALERVRSVIIDEFRMSRDKHGWSWESGSPGRSVDIIDRELAALPPTATVAQPAEQPGESLGPVKVRSLPVAASPGLSIAETEDWMGKLCADDDLAYARAEVAELRAKLEAAENRVKCAIADRQHAEDIQAELARDLAAARADQRAVAVEELRKFSTWYHDFRAGGYPTALGIQHYLDNRIAALTAPAADPAKMTPADRLKERYSQETIDEMQRRQVAYGNPPFAQEIIDKVQAKGPLPESAPNPSETPNSSPTFDLAAEMAHDIRVAFEGDPKDCAFKRDDHRWRELCGRLFQRKGDAYMRANHFREKGDDGAAAMDTGMAMAYGIAWEDARSIGGLLDRKSAQGGDGDAVLREFLDLYGGAVNPLPAAVCELARRALEGK